MDKELEAARERLLDLTMRNRLLNYRPTKARTIRVVNEIPREIYDLLVLKERKMTFLPKPETEQTDDTVDNGERAQALGAGDEGSTLTEQEASIIWKIQPEKETEDHRYDRFLQTLLEKGILQKRLFYIYQQAKSILEELGHTVLFLALGFLEWKESEEAGQLRRAPLILVPIELERLRVGTSFKVKWTGEEILTNISLQAKLLEQGIRLSDFEMPEREEEIDRFFISVQEAVSPMSEWKVLTDITLDFFSFTKFVMYKDLDPKAWPEGHTPAEHHLIQAILDPGSVSQDYDSFFEGDIDEKLRSWDTYHVMDGDPSQIAVIEEVKGGSNLVVEGPPGTGKSQTITNVIAELLASKKSVLFVSEKMAALEVVKSRLDKVGLGQFCLELHSRKRNKKEFLKELERTLSLSVSEISCSEEKYEELERLKRDLNDYAKALREPFGTLETTPFALLSILEKVRRHFEKVGRPMPHIRFPEAEKCDRDQWKEAMARLRNLSEILPLIRPVSGHPFFGCEATKILPADEREIEDLLGKSVEKLDRLLQKLGFLSEKASISPPETVGHLEGALKAARVIAASKPTDRNVLLNEEWNRPSEKSAEIIRKVETFQGLIGEIREKYRDEALRQDVSSILNEYKNQSKRRFRFLRGAYRRIRHTLRDMYKEKPPRQRLQVLTDLETLKVCLDLRAEIRGLPGAGVALFGSHWNAEESNVPSLTDFSKWIVQFRQQLITKALKDDAVDRVSSGVSRSEIEARIREVVAAFRGFVETYKRVTAYLKPDHKRVFSADIKEVTFHDLKVRLEGWLNAISFLQRWTQYVEARNGCLKTVTGPMIPSVEKDEMLPEDVVPAFEANFSEELLRIAFKERDALSSFVGDLHEKKIGRFMRLDRELIQMNRQRLLAKLFQDRPAISRGASSGSEAGILLGEFGKKRRHMPIRKLMSAAGGLIERIKPCFMMSPLSIAQFLDPLSSRFDVIIFDEASQVKPEDALGALLRGNKVAVFGDTRQLPPTTFFENVVEAREEEHEEIVSASVSDVESILHQCKRCFPTKTLSWHYRSKHESLIAVSNQEFYDNRLLIYPSPRERSETHGLQFVHLPETVYDRGRSSTNRKEAKAVARAAVEHYRSYPGKSLGVGTFNIRQQQAILEEIELQVHLDREVEGFFRSNRHEHFFVKNLETIQGDERDVIFISVGFGFDQGRRLSLNFGPLNQDGGERRLNVLITRARERCVVFSNFQAKDLALDHGAPFGIRAFKTFLSYAENGDLIQTYDPQKDVESPFEASVYEFLRTQGVIVRKQVGCAGFRVDLAVVDPDNAGRYLMGIECDGAKYHSSPVARDRDRLRQQILEKLGWRIHRIWSTDWYRNRKECEGNLIRVIKEARRLGASREGGKSGEPGHKKEGEKRNEKAQVIKFPGEAIVQRKDFRGEVPWYQVCTSLGIPATGELHEQLARVLAVAVSNVVEVEGPVHVDEVVHRIRTLWGLKRSGLRIVKAVHQGVKAAERQGTVRRRGDFLWPASRDEVKVRRRSNDPPPKIEFICDEEIEEAVKIVLGNQFATAKEDLVQQGCRLLGIKATREHTAERVRSVISALIKKGELEELQSGMIQLRRAV
ncbi:MAG: DUF3320 domain-containing protein [Pseudomonadota bacterium]